MVAKKGNGGHLVTQIVSELGRDDLRNSLLNAWVFRHQLGGHGTGCGLWLGPDFSLTVSMDGAPDLEGQEQEEGSPFGAAALPLLGVVHFTSSFRAPPLAATQLDTHQVATRDFMVGVAVLVAAICSTGINDEKLDLGVHTHTPSLKGSGDWRKSLFAFT
uniref:Uncharacterized protein n=1 Tax=Sphaerodactylus townsendi TaxID=933632 RepID=A0ACB8GF47_9SAUR